MDHSDELITRLIEKEGGYNNYAADRGGPTKYGITLATLHEWRQAPVGEFQVQTLSEDEARAIYRSQYFTKPSLDAVTDPMVQEFLFDYAVNSGPTAAVKALQTALGVTVDGSFGPQSKAALAKVNNMPALFYRLKCERYELLLRYVGRDPSQAIFAAGWANRLDQFEETSDMKRNLDVVKSLLADVPIGIGLLAGLLAAVGLSEGEVKYITGIVVAGAALALWLIVSTKRALNQTDAGKAATIERLDDAGKAAVLEKLPDVTKAAAAAQVEGLKVVPTTIEGAQILQALPPAAKAANT